MEQRIRAALTSLFDAQTAQAATLDNLGGHASLRIYWRIHLPSPGPRDEHTLMAMVLPQGKAALASEEGGSSEDPTPEELPFVDVHRYLTALEMPVPEIDLVDMELGVLILEDLGDELFENLYLDIAHNFGPDMADLRVPIEQLYHRAITLLVDFQRTVYQANHEGSAPETIAHQRAFDRELLRWELDHYLEWGLQKHYEDPALEPHVAQLGEIFDRIVEELFALPQALVLRDYQSRNLMSKHEQLYMIDFQDALRGPFIYDLVALLRDSYIELPYVIVHRLVTHYAHQGMAAGLPWCEDEDAVHRAFNLQTVQRKLKDAGRFIYIDRVKGNPDFLGYYEPSIGYVKQALRMLPEYHDLTDILEEFEQAWDLPAPEST